ncbi:MAG: hypothetical protein V4520_06425 [Bacteroidota bacterium]
MDSIIHSIQEGVNQLFGIQSQTSAPIIISLSIFIIGLAFAEISKSIGRVRKRNTTKKIFFLNLNNLTLQVSDQAKAYVRQSQLQDLQYDLSGNQYSLPTAVFYSVGIIKQIGYDDLYKAFFTGTKNTFFKKKSFKNRIKAFNDLWGVIENVVTWQEITHSQWGNLMQHFNEANKKRESAIDNYFKFIRPEMFKAMQDKQHTAAESDYLLKVLEINNKYFALKKYTYPIVAQSNLVQPILILDDEFKEKVSLVYTSSMYLQKASAGFYEMKAIITNCRDMFLQQAQLFATYSLTLDDSKDALSK